MNVISLEEYKERVYEEFHVLCRAYPKKDVDEYLKLHEKDIEEGYKQELAVMHLTHCPPSPSGCAYGMALEF